MSEQTEVKSADEIINGLLNLLDKSSMIIPVREEPVYKDAEEFLKQAKQNPVPVEDTIKEDVEMAAEKYGANYYRNKPIMTVSGHFLEGAKWQVTQSKLSPSVSGDKVNQEDRISKAIEIFKDYEQLEANIISANELWWPYRENDVLRGEIYEKFIELQAKRNEFLQSLK